MQVQPIKIIQMIIITLIFIVVGIVIVGILSNNNSIAYYDDETHNMQIVEKNMFFLAGVYSMAFLRRYSRR